MLATLVGLAIFLAYGTTAAVARRIGQLDVASRCAEQSGAPTHDAGDRVSPGFIGWQYPSMQVSAVVFADWPEETLRVFALSLAPAGSRTR